jgi:hypothetical protein
MQLYDEDEEELLLHTFSCFRTALYYLLNDGYGIYVSKPKSDGDDSSYIVGIIDGQLRIFPVDGAMNLKEGSLIKLSEHGKTPHVH